MKASDLCDLHGAFLRLAPTTEELNNVIRAVRECTTAECRSAMQSIKDGNNVAPSPYPHLVGVSKTKGSSVIITESDQGALMCSCKTKGRPYYCIHVTDFIKSNHDAGHLPQKFSVPLFSQPEPIGMQCYLEDPSNGMNKVHLVINDSEEAFLGFVDSTEGRASVRRMIIEWLRSRFRMLEPCESSYHEHGKGIPFSSGDDYKREPDNIDLINTVMLLQTNECMGCASLSDAGIPDLSNEGFRRNK